MNIFKLFKFRSKKQTIETQTEEKLVKEKFDVTTIVQRMFNEASVSFQRPEKNVFLTVVDGIHCSFKTILKCDKNSIFIYVSFPLPVQEHIADLISYELNRLNKQNKYKSEIAIQESNGEYSIFAFTNCNFDTAPTTTEVKDLMIHTIDILDNENFRSMACAICGYASYKDLEKAMTTTNSDGNKVEIQLADGYSALHNKTNGITPARYEGRLIMLSTHIVRNKISQKRARGLLDDNTPLSIIMQEAYKVADETERDILRKLRYLTLCKKYDYDSDNDEDRTLGMLEAFSMIDKDMESLLYGSE